MPRTLFVAGYPLGSFDHNGTLHVDVPAFLAAMDVADTPAARSEVAQLIAESVPRLLGREIAVTIEP